MREGTPVLNVQIGGNGASTARLYIRGLSQKVVDFSYDTRLCIRNSLKCV